MLQVGLKELEGLSAMDDFETSASDSDYANSWISWFLGCKGNEYFCEIDDDYITDRFNLTYLNNEVHHYNDALELITDSFGASLCNPNHADSAQITMWTVRHESQLKRPEVTSTASCMHDISLRPEGCKKWYQ